MDFDKIQYHFMLKTLSMIGLEEIFHYKIKKFNASIILEVLALSGFRQCPF